MLVGRQRSSIVGFWAWISETSGWCCGLQASPAATCACAQENRGGGGAGERGLHKLFNFCPGVARERHASA